MIDCTIVSHNKHARYLNKQNCTQSHAYPAAKQILKGKDKPCSVGELSSTSLGCNRLVDQQTCPTHDAKALAPQPASREGASLALVLSVLLTPSGNIAELLSQDHEDGHLCATARCPLQVA